MLVDVYENDNEVIVELAIPHIDPEKVEVSVSDNMLHVKGSTDKTTEVEDKNYYRKEISSGSFYRTIPLPDYVKADEAKAEHEDGILKITMPKKEQKPKSKSIKVTVKKK